MSAPTTRALKATWVATQVASRFSTRLGGTFASRLWFTPWPVPMSERAVARQAEWLSAVEPVSFHSRVGPIAGFGAGVGSPILLVHGWGERGAFLGGFVRPLVQSGFRVIGMDLPAHGHSPGRETNIFECADAVLDVAHQVGARAVVAHSMGGTVTSVAISRGLDVDGVVLVSPASDLDNVVAKFGSMFSLSARVLHQLRGAIERRFGPDIWDRLMLTDLVSDFDTPALIVHDRDDDQIDLADSEALSNAWPDARLMVTSGLGHDRIMRDSGVHDATRAFLMDTIDPHRTRAMVGSTNARVLGSS